MKITPRDKEFELAKMLPLDLMHRFLALTTEEEELLTEKIKVINNLSKIYKLKAELFDEATKREVNP